MHRPAKLGIYPATCLGSERANAYVVTCLQHDICTGGRHYKNTVSTVGNLNHFLAQYLHLCMTLVTKNIVNTMHG